MCQDKHSTGETTVPETMFYEFQMTQELLDTIASLSVWFIAFSSTSLTLTFMKTVYKTFVKT